MCVDIKQFLGRNILNVYISTSYCENPPIKVHFEALKFEKSCTDDLADAHDIFLQVHKFSSESLPLRYVGLLLLYSMLIRIAYKMVSTVCCAVQNLVGECLGCKKGPSLTPLGLKLQSVSKVQVRYLSPTNRNS